MPPLPTPVRLITVPRTTGLAGAPAMLAEGSGLTVTVLLAVLVAPRPSVTDTVYVVVELGVAITVPPLLEDSPVDGLQLKLYGKAPWNGRAVSVALLPLQTDDAVALMTTPSGKQVVPPPVTIGGGLPGPVTIGGGPPGPVTIGGGPPGPVTIGGGPPGPVTIGGGLPGPVTIGGGLPPPVDGGAQVVSARATTGVHGKLRLALCSTSPRSVALPAGVRDSPSADAAIRLAARLAMSAAPVRPFRCSLPLLALLQLSPWACWRDSL